jgi:glycosyltransferase involved in cell wall biosynthesis
MPENLLVSIVTPSFNQAEFLLDTIDSVLNQDYANVEYIIVDGGSTDGSVAVIEQFAEHLAWWVSEKDHGQTDAINKGFEHAKGQILAWINSDDTYEPGAIAAAVEYLLKHPDVGMVYSNANYINEQGRVIGKFPAAQTDYHRLQQGYVHIPQQTAFFRRTLWQEVGPLDPSFYFAMDYDLWVRIASRSKVKYLPDKTWANFRLHMSAKTMNADDRCWSEMLRVHYRDGGGFFALIVLKYYIRKLIAPWWNRRRQRLLKENP